MTSKFLAASFYAERSVDGFLDDLGVMDRHWGPFSGVYAGAKQLSYHAHATVRFSLRQFMGLREDNDPDDPVPLAQDGALEFAYFFRDAAARTGCEVAFFAADLNQAEGEWIDERYYMVIARDAPTLAAERFGLLYLDDQMVLDWDNPHIIGRNMLPGGPGLTLFARTGWARW